jgi:hypothetical protein
MNDPNEMRVIRLNQIITKAQQCIQSGQDMEHVWAALYVPSDLRHPASPPERSEG